MELDKYGTAQNLQDLLGIRNDIERLATRHLPQDAATPKLELFDLGDAYRLILEVPGVAQENLEVAIQENTLIVAGLREPVEEGLQIVISERYRGHFQRELRLPSAVDREASQAHLQDGLLTLTLPKAG